MSFAIVQQTYEASAALVAIVGDRIVQGLMPQTYTRPYLIWFVATSVPDNTLSERPQRDDARIQTDIYAASQTDARAAKDAALYAAESIGHVVFGPWESYEPETKLYRWSFDLEIWNPR